jgi:acyl-CoA synthetase (NDP forming)
VARRKPVVALIGGRTPPGREAARRHTGSAAPTDAQAAALCRDAGLVRVTSLRELLLAGKALAAHPDGIGRRVLLLSNSGGPGVLCADRCADEGLALPALPAKLETRLRAFFPPEAVAANPLDLLADAREDRFGETLQAVIDEAGGAFDAILAIHVVPFMVDANPVVARLASLARDARLPMLHAMMGTLEGKQDWMRQMEQAGVPLFDNVEDMAAAAGLLAGHREAGSAMQGGPA